MYTHKHTHRQPGEQDLPANVFQLAWMHRHTHTLSHPSLREQMEKTDEGARSTKQGHFWILFGLEGKDGRIFYCLCLELNRELSFTALFVHVSL